jgi:hypothetical protein
MSQADNRNTTELSRRTALAGLAGAAAAAVVGGTALAAVTPDLIFAVIAEHRTNVEEYGPLCLAAGNLTNRLWAEQRPEIRRCESRLR